MSKKWLSVGMAALLCCAGVGHARALEPEDVPCTVLIGGAQAQVMQTAVNHSRTWTSRPMLSRTPVVVAVCEESPLEIQVAYPGVKIETCVVRPLSLGIEAALDGEGARFTLPGPMDVTVEINGGVEGALHLFLSAPDADKPDPDDPAVIFLGAGEHEGIITPESGQTVYLDEGCVLRGAIHAQGVQDVRVAGRGIIDGSGHDRWEDTLVPVDFADAQGIRIEGITILDPSAWTLNLYRCQDVEVAGVRIVGARSNSDGITIQSCERVHVTDCFVRGWDDNLVVKGYDGDARDITFERCVLWTDLAQSCEIGYETRADVIERIVFRDITVLHNFHKPVMSVHNSDNALVRDILFESIVVEDAQMGRGDGAVFLIELTTTKSQWSKAKERGRIRGVVFDGVRVLDGIEGSVRIFSFGKDANIDDVELRNIEILGQHITSFDELNMNVNRHNGENIVIVP